MLSLDWDAMGDAGSTIRGVIHVRWLLVVPYLALVAVVVIARLRRSGASAAGGAEAPTTYGTPTPQARALRG